MEKEKSEEDIIAELYTAENIRMEVLEDAIEILNAALKTYGLMRGQHVASHERHDPRTGGTFKAGSGGTGSPKRVMGEGKTVAPARTLDRIGDRAGIGGVGDLANIADIVPESDIDNPDMLETIIRNLELAKVAEIEAMANDAFMLPESRTKGRLCELILKEVLRRGLVEQNELEKKMGEMAKSADDGFGRDQ